ncbi:MAG TPA: triose-phosphate isomerase, partial [Thermoplasmatales archaeon]|nr:triose-phosphate isomerase [Thermoplasmatales archaeon]
MNVIVVNVKTYKEGTGKNALELARIMEDVGNEYGIRMIIAVQPTDIFKIADDVSIEVFSQHMDAIDYGSNTGWILPHAIKEAGAKGVLVNHSEHRMKLEDIAFNMEMAKKIGLQTIACAGNVNVARALATFKPDYVAIEPPELIGGEISVTSARPEVIKNAVDAVRGINENVEVLCGAGIKNGGDVARAIELGAKGILVASGVVKAKDRKMVLEDMARALVK